MKRRAFISVYDKVGLIDFVRNLTEKFEYEVVAGGDSYEFLKKADVEVIDAKQYLGASGLFENVDTVNENVIAGILSSGSDMTELEKLSVKPFDMVVVNLYPFEELSRQAMSIEDAISKIDIAGITMLRAGAKNYKNVTVITDKVDYYVALNSNEFGRFKLAAKAFNLTSNYDRLLCSKMAEETGEKPFKSFNFEKIDEMPYGENPHQHASIFKSEKMVDYEVINQKLLSYNNILNLTEAVDLVSEFYDVNCVAIVRHTKPCGVALGRSLYEAYTKAFDCDPVSSFYGVVGFSKPVDAEVAKHLNSMAVEVIVAPDYDEAALELFKDNPEIKLVKLNTPLKDYRKLTVEEVILTPFGVLVQDRNNSELDKNKFNVVTQEKPTKEQIEDAIFAWKVVKHAKTNSVVVAKDFKTIAISQGQTNALNAVENALDKACDGSKGAIMASDAALPSEDCIYPAIQGRISLIIQPGGAIKDESLIKVCDKYGMAMITTGIRNYRH